jgi:hypothetical protein
MAPQKQRLQWLLSIVDSFCGCRHFHNHVLFSCDCCSIVGALHYCCQWQCRSATQCSLCNLSAQICDEVNSLHPCGLASGRESGTLACMQDFLKIDPQSAMYRDVDAVLLDPSCSGSGTAATRLDHLFCTQAEESSAGELERDDVTPDVPEAEKKRVQRLAAFQKRALEHALSFPAAVRVVYSTCSVYVEENERVVAAVLPVAKAAGFSLAHALPQWHRRGAAGSYSWAEKVVRVHPVIDGLDGFFVAVFERCCGAGSNL